MASAGALTSPWFVRAQARSSHGPVGLRYGVRMAAPAVIVEALPAGYGDSLLVTCKLRRGVWRMLVDTGPDECWPMLEARLAEIPPDKVGRRRIDLAVISHIDHDHIGGGGALFGDRELGLSFGDVWFNAPKMPASRGVAEGQSLATLLGAPDTPLPWNRAWAVGTRSRPTHRFLN